MMYQKCPGTRYLEYAMIGHCVRLKYDNSCANGWRSGRFKLNEEQDRYLKENDGIYVFVVHVSGEIKHTCLRKASLISGVSGQSCGRVWNGVLA